MVARRAGAAGPVLLACRQWDLLGLARRLPSRGAGAWLGAPLLPWWLHCPGRVCAALSAGLGRWGRCRVLCLSRSPPSRPAFPALRVAGGPVWVSLTLARWYAIPCGLCFPRAWSGCPSGIPRVPFACVCAPALAASAPFLPPPVGVARAPRMVPVQGAGRAVPCGPWPSAFAASVSCTVWLVFGGGLPGSVPPTLARGRVPPCGQACACGAVRRRVDGWVVRGGGAAFLPPPPGAWPGAPEGRGVALPRSVPRPSLGGHQSGCHRRRSVHGGCGLYTAPGRVRVLTQGVGRGAPLGAGAGPPAYVGHCGSRQVAAWGRVAFGFSGILPQSAPAPLRGGGGGGGGSPGLGGGRGLAPPRPVSSIPRAGGGERGGERGRGSRRGSSPPSSGFPARTPGGYGGLACSPRPWSPLMASGVAPRISPCSVLGRGCLAAPGAGRGLAGCWWVSLVGGGGGRCAAPRWGLGGGASGGGGGGSVCLGLSLCPPAGGTVVALPPTLHRLASACRRPDAVRGVPLRAG